MKECYSCKHEEICCVKRDLFERVYPELCKVFDAHYYSESEFRTDRTFVIMLAENCKHFSNITGESPKAACARIISTSNKALRPSDVNRILREENHPRTRLKWFSSNIGQLLNRMAIAGKIERLEVDGFPYYRDIPRRTQPAVSPGCADTGE